MLLINKIPFQNKFLNPTKKESRYSNGFWLGFIAYTVSYTFSQSGHLNYKILQGVQSAGLLLVVGSAFRMIRFKLESGYLKNLFAVFFCWQLLIILRGFSFDYAFIKEMLFDSSYGMMAYLAPAVLLLPRNIVFYKKAFDVILLFGVFYILYDILFIRDLLNADHASIKSTSIVEYSALLSIPVCFLLLSFPYHTTKRLLFSIAVISLTLFFCLYRARRGLLFICSSQLILAYIIFLFKSKNKVVAVISSVVVILVGIYLVKDSFIENKENIFNYLAERGTHDTRTGVEEYFYSDLDTKDWIVGKGINGQYFCPNIDEDASSAYRRIIETGYLQIILNGGIISLALLMLIAVPAVYKGLFRSSNTLSKAAGFWILLWIFYLYPATMQTFSLYYVVFWLSVGICYSKSIRNIPETRMKLLFLSKNGEG